ncbi:hypothetical protein EYC84_000860 [Monilinia fructicola]|uniref:Uncharacterized protein n=1 Tax=Monilinia fructicola TaxID=38448 RepID=A0A5M9JIS9_MONFR|nr:hypothetical protein EYC84_000860 [Monilinia fructicola]
MDQAPQDIRRHRRDSKSTVNLDDSHAQPNGTKESHLASHNSNDQYLGALKIDLAAGLSDIRTKVEEEHKEFLELVAQGKVIKMQPSQEFAYNMMRGRGLGTQPIFPPPRASLNDNEDYRPLEDLEDNLLSGVKYYKIASESDSTNIEVPEKLAEGINQLSIEEHPKSEEAIDQLAIEERPRREVVLDLKGDKGPTNNHYKGKEVWGNFGYLNVNGAWVDPDSEKDLAQAFRGYPTLLPEELEGARAKDPRIMSPAQMERILRILQRLLVVKGYVGQSGGRSTGQIYGATSLLLSAAGVNILQRPEQFNRMDPQTDMNILAKAYGSPNAFKDDSGWSDTTTLPVFHTKGAAKAITGDVHGLTDEEREAYLAEMTLRGEAHFQHSQWMAKNRDGFKSDKIVAFNGLVTCMKELYFIKQWLNNDSSRGNPQVRRLVNSISLDTPFKRTERTMISKDNLASTAAADPSLQGLSYQDRTYMRLIEDIYHGTNNLTLHLQNQVMAWGTTKAEIETKVGEYYNLRDQIMAASGMDNEFIQSLIPISAPKTPRVNF